MGKEILLTQIEQANTLDTTKSFRIRKSLWLSIPFI